MILPESLYMLTDRDLRGKLATEVNVTAQNTDTALIVTASLEIPNPDRQLFVLDNAVFRGLDGSNTQRVVEVVVEVESSDGMYGNGHTVAYTDHTEFTNGAISKSAGKIVQTMLFGVHPDLTFVVSGTFLQAIVGNSVQLHVHGWLIAPGTIYS